MQQNPIVVDLAPQPAVTPEITYPEVILSAIGVAGVIMVLAALAGLLTGAVIIYLKKRADATRTSNESGHVTLRI